MLSASESLPDQDFGLFFKQFVPSGWTSGSPMVLLTHGRTGTSDVMWFFTRAFHQLQPLVLAPQGALPDELGGFSWWPVNTSDPQASARTHVAGDNIWEAQDKIIHFIERARSYFGFSSVIALGFSQGGALVSSLSLRAPELFSGVALLASFVPRIVFEEPRFVDSRVTDGSLKLPPYLFCHGTQDEIVTLERAQLSIDSLRSVGASVELVTDDVGHKVGFGVHGGLHSGVGIFGASLRCLYLSG